MKHKATNGATLKKFLADESVWNPAPGESWYYDDVFFDIQDGVSRTSMDLAYDLYGENLERLPDAMPVVIESGDMCWQGVGEPRRQCVSLEERFTQWEKAQSVLTVVAVLEVPTATDQASLEDLNQRLRALGAVRVSGLPEEVSTKPRIKPA